MDVIEFFKPISSISAAELRELLAERHPDDIQIVDVRPVDEYEKGHLPCAIPCPLSDLLERARDLDPERITVICCRSGMRSHAAAALLQGSGFRRVQVLDQGIESWQGTLAEGQLQPLRFPFTKVDSLKEFIALSWYMEDATRQFYLDAAKNVSIEPVRKIFSQLVDEEQKHQKTLAGLFEIYAEADEAKNFPYSVFPEFPGPRLLEGGYGLDEARKWATYSRPRDVVDLALSIETNAYDRYQNVRQMTGDKDAQRILEIIAGEEKRHLQRLNAAWEEVCDESCPSS